MPDDMHGPTIHNDPNLFRESLTFTESETGFGMRLIEKDYYCSVVLHDLTALFEQGLVFRGGTCLSKVHVGFYRLSEDLDLIISIPVDSPRSQRRAAIAPVKDRLADVPKRVPAFTITEDLRGHNASRQYVGSYSYQSAVTGEAETIKVEVGLREPIVLDVEHRRAQTILHDPFKNAPAVAGVSVAVFASDEAYAEKIRAALTRRDPAIRDFYDIDYAVNIGKLDVKNAKLLDLVRKKVAVPGNDPVDVSDAKLTELQRQVDGQLKPVLRPVDLDQFDLQRSFAQVAAVAGAIQD